MVTIPCGQNATCPYQYQCIENSCQHLPIFPLGGYPIAVYLFFPIAAAICNTSGNSFGEFKVLLLMDILNYSEAEATTLCYPLVLGTALFNLARLVRSRHPSKQIPIVDYNLVTIIIPNVLYGSTIGSLLNNLMPPILADVLIVAILVAFTLKFFMKLLRLKKKLAVKDQEHLIPNELENEGDKQIGVLPTDNSADLSLQALQLSEPLFSASQQSMTSKKQLYQQLEYEKTFQLPHILTILGLFVGFEALAFMAQGKIIKFSICSEYYGLGVGLLTLAYLGTTAGIYFHTKKKMAYFKRIKYEYEYPLDTFKWFGLICLGSFLGGFNGGAFAIGNSTTIIFTLLYLEVEQVVVAATVGFQVAFAAAASLCQALATDTIELDVVGFFFVVTLVLGGALSYLVNHFVKKMNRDRVNMTLVAIVAGLTSMSALSMVLSIVLGYVNFGSDYMNSSSGLCP